jgi:hypothetical protein
MGRSDPQRFDLLGARPLLAFAALALVVAILIIGYPKNPVVFVHNRSGVALESIWLHGSGFSETISRIEVGETFVLRVAPRGESGLAVEFYAGGEHRKVPQQGSFEPRGGYRVRVEIGPDLEVAIRSSAPESRLGRRD